MLREIANWLCVSDGHQSQIYVLDGIAGIGKSTVAQTFAERAAELGYLGASFFFSRNEDQRKNAKLFFSSIAFQLSLYDEHIATLISMALKQVPDAAGKRLRDQFKELIIDPLQTFCKADSHPILIIIDALDECEEWDAAEVLLLLIEKIHRLSSFRVLITTRPEAHIRKMLHNGKNHKHFYLHEIETSIVEADIRLYLGHELSGDRIHETLPELELPCWEPSASDMDCLVQAAGKLFIIASTAVRFILDSEEYNPESQVAKLLQGVASDYSSQDPLNALDDMYIQILQTAIPENSNSNIIERFQKVVGTVVLLQNPLPYKSLAGLLGLKTSDIAAALNRLHSIIAPSSQDQSPQIYHKSFPDFITNIDRCKKDCRFLITPDEHHSWIASQCFYIMNRDLHQNICNLGFFEQYMENEQINHFVKGKISGELGYACLYWATHLSKAKIGNDKLHLQLEEFACVHLLHWLEVLSLMGKLDVAYPALDNACNFVVSDYLHIYYV